MTIAAWNVVLNAIILVLLAVYGIWLKYVFSQQLSSKDATIEALKTTIASKDAVIDGLERETAPAMAESYKRVKEHANTMSLENEKLEIKLANLTTKDDVLEERLRPVRLLLAESTSLVDAVCMVMERLNPFFPWEQPTLTLEERLAHANDAVFATHEALLSIEAKSIAKSEKAISLLTEFGAH
jgi:hypothetical protein